MERCHPTGKRPSWLTLRLAGPVRIRLEKITSGRRKSGKTDDWRNGPEIESHGVSGTGSPTLLVGGSRRLSATSANQVAESSVAGGADEGVSLAEVSRDQRDGTNQATSDSAEYDREKTSLECDNQPFQAEYRSAIKRAPPWPAIPGYELLEKLGEGGMGVVYLARQTGLNRLVAVKMVRGGSAGAPRRTSRGSASRPRPSPGSAIPTSFRSTTSARSTTSRSCRSSCSKGDPR